MDDFEFGPVELILAAFEGDDPSPEVIQAVLSLDDSGTIRVLDLIQLSRSEDGTVSFVEMEVFAGDSPSIELPGRGLASEEDVAELAESLPLGSSALLLVAEHRWATHLASRLAAADGFVVDSIRIPAPVVNAVAVAATVAD